MDSENVNAREQSEMSLATGIWNNHCDHHFPQLPLMLTVCLDPEKQKEKLAADSVALTFLSSL